MKTAGLVLAAGQSQRMGDFKPLMCIQERTLLETAIQSLFDGGVQHVTVVLGHRAAEVEALMRKEFDAKRVGFVANTAYENTDMLHSIQIGLRVLPPCDAFYLLPGDMPAVKPSTFRALAMALAEGDTRVAFPMFTGRRKHPPLIRSDCMADILGYEGVGGLRGIWQAYTGKIAEVPAEDEGCGLDADTMEDFAVLKRYLEQMWGHATARPAPESR